MPDVEPKVWGCLECGAFSEELTADGFCPTCREGLVVELGGDPSPEKAQALIAWARRDATETIQNRGTIIGAAAGFVIAVLLSLISTRLGAGVLVLLLYTCALGALAGRLSALRVHRLLWPQHKLQPIRDEALRRRLIGAIILWLLLPVAVGIGFAIFGGEARIEVVARRALGSVWALLTGS